jgi:hypothetical protein
MPCVENLRTAWALTSHRKEFAPMDRAGYKHSAPDCFPNNPP